MTRPPGLIGLNLWLDDLRAPGDFAFPLNDTYWAKTYDQAIQFLELPGFRPAYIISLDNDLGEEKEGYDILKYMAELSFNGADNIWPRELRVHSANSVALANMRATIDRYGPYPRSLNGWTWRRET